MPLALGSKCRQRGRWTVFRSASIAVRARPIAVARHADRAAPRVIAGRTTRGPVVRVADPAADREEAARGNLRASRASAKA